MAGIVELNKLLKYMSPELKDGEYVFCSVSGAYSEYSHLEPLATFRESEGLTLVLLKESALKGELAFKATFKLITLSVHWSLEAVALTAAVASKLA